MSIKLPVVAALLAAGALAAPSTANAAGVGKSWRGYTFINKGVFDLGVENLLLYRSNSTPLKGIDVEDGELKTSEFAYQGGVTGRYFVIRNLALGANLNFFTRSNTVSTEPAGGGETVEETHSDLGFLGFGMAHYYIRLGNSFFLTPGVGAGFFSGTRETPVAGNASTKKETSISGPAARFDFGAVFYAGPQFNLKAGLTVIGRFGEETFDAPEGGGSAPDPVEFTSVDAAFNIGLGYSF